ncbi:MAG: hypothetical protein K2X81_05245 [Candidatus Obscuribacterales bacterium]|nr:hypothetical protein [Candidatus Obscuribacterales bacterium]
MKSSGRAVSRLNRGKMARSQSGSVLIGAVLVTLGFVVVALPVIIFYANLSTQLTLQGTAAHIATQAASVVDDYRYWLDAPRPGFNQAQAIQTASNAAKSMCEQVGIKDSKVKITFETDSAGNDLTVCTLEANASERLPSKANLFGFDMSSYFNGKLNVRGCTVHSKIPAYAITHMDAPTVDDQVNSRPLGLNRRDVAVIPNYGFFNMMVAGEGQPTYYGKGIAPLAPENFFAMNYYHLKKSDLNHVSVAGNEVPLAGWHPTRLIDGKKETFR